MRLRHFAGLATAVTVTLTGGLPGPTASATTNGETLYVNPTVPCSDTGSGSALPYCTVQSAVDAAQPGQTVQVAPKPGGYREAVTVRHSGTPGNPITITTGAWNNRTDAQTAFVQPDNAATAFTLQGVHDVVIRNFEIGSAGQAAVLTSASQITLDHLGQDYEPPLKEERGSIQVLGPSNGDTISRSLISGNGTPVLLDEAETVVGAPTGTVITANELAGGQSPTIVTQNAASTTITNNTLLQNCGTLVTLTGQSNSAQIFNNILDATGTGCAGQSPLLSLDIGSAFNSLVSHNLLNAVSGGVPYSWAGKLYNTPADLMAANAAAYSGPGSGAVPGTGDLVADPQLGQDGFADNGLKPTSPALNSADDKAPGILPTDLNGNPIEDDTQAPHPGTGHRDRGAYQLQSLTPATVRLDNSEGPYPVTVTATASSQQNWPTTVSYSFDFGDGTPAVVSDNPSAKHTYQKAGSFTVAMTQTDAAGNASTYQIDQPVKISPPGLPAVAFTAAPCTMQIRSCLHPLVYAINTSGTTGPWPITGYTVDYGDGSPVASNTLPHAYRTAGDYQVTVTATDQGGQTGSLTKTVKVGYRPSNYSAYPPVRVADTRSGSHPTKLAPGGKLTLNVGDSGIPADWAASAVVLNVTAVKPTGGGYLTAAPGGLDQPKSSNINYTPGSIVSNLVTVPVGTDGTVNIWNGGSGSPVDVVVDAIGQYTPDTGSQYAPVAPVRLMDTRYGIGVPTAGPISSNCTTTLAIRGQGGVPAQATYAVLNMTVTSPQYDGFLTVGHTKATSNLNFSAGQTVANQVIAPIDPDGTVTICNTGGLVHVIADVFGYYSADGGSLFTAVPPKRLTDTRYDGTGTLGAGASHAVDSGAPAGATGAVLNVTAVTPTGSGFLTVWADGTPQPGTSNVNFTAKQIVPNHAITPLGANGKFDIYNRAGQTDVIADLFGYFAKP
ncbi:PKD domain-containing protein [Kitasatospora sp. MAP5-34]|uniref:PKD domain-containing protein n=1 Tax=Kitasatospora sp. MAP5-34 TaxID=3035102 RepID=UPI002474E542|nr:PKD domain-containing protein [Kitasatospora sp. MAP5-34]MDH6576329.1 PKD repeat protein [Kitasatospora sp. MAP5-34]